MPKTKKPAEKPKEKPFKSSIWVVMQHGGSSTELYIHSFDTEKQAKDYIVDTKKHSYDCDVPFEIHDGGTVFLVEWEGVDDNGYYIRIMDADDLKDLTEILEALKKKVNPFNYSLRNIDEEAHVWSTIRAQIREELQELT